MSASDNVGLAGFSFDLVQDPMNPVLFDLPLAAGCDCIPSGMATLLTNFHRPHGIDNPPLPGSVCGFCGTLVGEPGAKNLRQIGGMQNTSGLVGSNIGHAVTVTGGVGQQANGQILVASSFAAPCKAGVYTFSIASVRANVLQSIAVPPSNSPTIPALTPITGQSFSITVQCIADFDHNGFVNGDDFDAFVVVFEAGEPSADIDGSTFVNGDDFDLFVRSYDLGCC